MVHATSQSSLNDVFEATCDRVFGFALKRCSSPALAEEITAQTYEAASRRFASGQGEQVTLPWLLTVARRRLIDHWRAGNSELQRMRRLRDETVRLAAVETLVATEVDDALASLSERHRSALVLRYLDDMSVTEVSDVLGLTYKATESLLTRARDSFADAYQEQQR